MKKITMQKMLNIFGSSASRSSVLAAELVGAIPLPERKQTGSLARRVWKISDLPALGRRFGFLKPPKSPVCVAIYSAKGGVFKTSLALNLARMSALNGIKTCVLGLDFQCDITRILGEPLEDTNDLSETIQTIWRRKGLLELLAGDPLDEIINHTDLPTLDYIAETAGLVTLERTIGAADRREFKLREFIKERLQPHYELVVIDCPPSWSHLITNALVACDVLVSPLECKVSQFNSLPVFMEHLATFKNTMGLKYEHLFIPSRFTPNKRLNLDIRNWYVSNLERVSTGVMRESVAGEEAIGLKMSLPEYAPSSLCADEMRVLLTEIWSLAKVTDRIKVAS